MPRPSASPDGMILPFPVCPRLPARRQTSRLQRAQRAFTLMELLVVISIMAIFIGLIGKLSSGSETNGLQAAQGMISGLLTAARSQAAIAPGGVARMLICADPNNADTNLRHLEVVVVDPTDPSITQNPSLLPTKFVTVGGGGLDLPQGVYVVPPFSEFNKHGYRLPNTPEWKTGETGFSASLSTSTSYKNANGQTVRNFLPDAQNLIVDGAAEAPFYWVEINALGAVSMDKNTAPTIVVLSSGIPQAAAPWFGFNNPNNVVGVLISQYGTQLMLNDVHDFQ